jgi:small subunit ribosomal protein S16
MPSRRRKDFKSALSCTQSFELDLVKEPGVHSPSMIKIRLKRFGKKRAASYRIVATNSRDRRDGRPLEELGYYNPISDEVTLKVEAITKWLSEGAQPTDTVRRILVKNNVLASSKS